MSNDPLIAALIDIASSARPALNAETLFSGFPTPPRNQAQDVREARLAHARRTVEILKGEVTK